MISDSASILSLEGPQNSSCGYCSPPGERSATASSCSVGVTASRLTCSDYQKMIDRGWRRSGDYCYKPDMRRTCCPQYTIRLDANEFTPTKRQRKVVYRWSRYILEGIGEVNDVDMVDDTPRGKKSKKPPAFSLVDSIHASEKTFYKGDTQPKHDFEVTIERASFTEEKFRLYCKYQKSVHKEADRHSSSGFERFLVETPLEYTPIQYGTEPPPHLPTNYGSHHQLYRLDGELIAMAVLDILPGCVSSVYFVYNSEWEKFSLGKLSALREAALAREMHEYGAKELKHLYMGYYIHSCQKMKYKGEYSPSFLLDPEEYTWYPLKECLPLLDVNRYACFAHPERSLKDSDIPLKSALKDISEQNAAQITIFHRSTGVVPLSRTTYRTNAYVRELILPTVEGLGMELSKKFILYL
ncbi:hypothetical protein M0805_003700 [Coniferiporia weirii]|nr:hypothetical protein M0805_003700 [Coniferiporia weirii]